MKFKLKTEFEPCGDQPAAIETLTKGLNAGRRAQVLLGITGSGKTFTMANVIVNVQKPTLILAHNKTLAAQLYQEFKQFFPENAVEYFVSYYDYYQPEAYIARTDTYIEKDLAINDRLERMRLSATRSLIERKDVIIIASVSCIYGIGAPEHYAKMRIQLKVGQRMRRDDFLYDLVNIHYKRNDLDLVRSSFRARGENVEVALAYEESLALRIEFFGDEIERISEIDPLTGRVIRRVEEATIYPGSHYVTPEDIRYKAIESIRLELGFQKDYFEQQNLLVEKQRIDQRTRYDVEMIKEIGFCKGIENYSRHFDSRSPGDPPSCLINYFPKDYLLIVDESHQSIPQIHAMFNGDQARKRSLVEFGFRLPSAFDNRPLKFDEFYKLIHQVVYVSATPAPFEIQEAEGEVVQQVIRPTGLLDPIVEIRPLEGQVDDCMHEIQRVKNEGGRVLVTTLTKKLSEDLSNYLNEVGVKAKYLHSDIDTLERVQIIKELRQGNFDVLVGINLLREGLDIPEVSLVVILDADKEGFLRSETALVQTCGRAARNVKGKVILYADKMTKAILATVSITKSRREVQDAYNKEHGITPRSVKRQGVESLTETFYGKEDPKDAAVHAQENIYSAHEIARKIKSIDKEMKKAAKEFRFEEATKLRDQLRYLMSLELLEDHPE